MHDNATIAIEARGLAKSFSAVLAVDAVDFDVREREMFGFLGPNGAGKTTTINALTGLARPTAGTIRYLGRDVTRNVKKAQHLMGVVARCQSCPASLRPISAGALRRAA